MTTITEERLVTTGEFLKLLDSAPDDVTLELVEGRVREFPMTTRSPEHSIAISRISHVLLGWLEAHPDRDGVVAAGEARCRIRTDPDTIIGLDVAYFEGVEYGIKSDGASFFDGPPVVAVEVLSPSDTHVRVSERIRMLLAGGVRQVWLADPEFRSVTVHRPDADQRLFSARQEIDGDPELPGFRCRIETLFGAHRAARN